MDSLVHAFNYAVIPLYVTHIPIPLSSSTNQVHPCLAVVCFCVDWFNIFKSLSNTENYFPFMSWGNQIGQENLLLSKMTCSVCWWYTVDFRVFQLLLIKPVQKSKQFSWVSTELWMNRTSWLAQLWCFAVSHTSTHVHLAAWVNANSRDTYSMPLLSSSVEYTVQLANDFFIVEEVWLTMREVFLTVLLSNTKISSGSVCRTDFL